MGELIFIGLGLYDERDITVKGKEAAADADRVFSEFYTSRLAGASIEDIEEVLGREVEVLSRDEVESGDIVLDTVRDHSVAFLTAGDPMAATTHVELRFRAIERGIKTTVIHGISIISAVPSILGVMHYKFGRTVTLPFLRERGYPRSPYDHIKANQGIGLHTLVLLDIDGERERYMTVNQGVEALLKLEDDVQGEIITEDTLMAGLARVGSDLPEIKVGAPKDLLDYDFGGGLHSMVVFGELHFMEEEALELSRGK